ncbi:hypothetical protein PSU4_39150 [Pseudonocardia sulfidoxydans NBRC 16205]|uniref:Uncharacterized protein n=1 Tax=Pseudonocardia sulfidoxydans NBRC 16205 TaxID=1223511 RepID=A0A511DJI1_9PSEU|nr:hypothetical protein [Pseudonocardia sulfidoxydans]GEL24961.1 hypothetical protein PSU4_39150 [Pseudonocardia sulfidoxydans NBRC 16205]
MGTPSDRPLLERLVRSVFPPGSFPEVVYSRAADEVLHHDWVGQVLRHEVTDEAADPLARLVGSAHGPALVEIISDAAVRAALDAARTERVAAGPLGPPA